MLIPFPNIPALPGVPAIPRLPLSLGDGTFDLAGLLSGNGAQLLGSVSGATAVLSGIIGPVTQLAGTIGGAVTMLTGSVTSSGVNLRGTANAGPIGLTGGVTIGPNGISMRGSVSIAGVKLLSFDGPGVAQVTNASIWGIFKNTPPPPPSTPGTKPSSASSLTPVVIADSVVSFSYDKEYRISDFPVERGNFASFNKVERPYEERMVFAKGGSDSVRAAFIKSLQAAVASLDLYDVVTPDATYINANVVRVGFDRTARNGVTLILAEVSIQEVRVATDTTFTNTTDPSGVAQQSGGVVQTAPPNAAQAAAKNGQTTQ